MNLPTSTWKEFKSIVKCEDKIDIDEVPPHIRAIWKGNFETWMGEREALNVAIEAINDIARVPRTIEGYMKAWEEDPSLLSARRSM